MWLDEFDPNAVCIPFSGVLELKLLDLPDDERENYFKENGCTRYSFISRGVSWKVLALRNSC